MTSICDIFSEFQRHIDEEQDFREEIRVIVRELEQKSREMLTTLQSVHHSDGLNNLSAICEDVNKKYEDVRQGYAQLNNKLPADQYYRYNDHWRFITQRLCFLAALVHYLNHEELLTRHQCATLLGVNVERGSGFHLDIEDYLGGLLLLASELSRLAVNSVTSGDFSRPIRISRFLANLDLGFRLLNLKNDVLRKKFDGLKYDLKKVEEVVYDVTIRGLVTNDSTATMATVPMATDNKMS